MTQTRRDLGFSGSPATLVLPCPPALGALLAVAEGGRLVELSFFDDPDQAAAAARNRPGARTDPEAAPLPRAAEQLAGYFAGRVRAFDLPLDPRGTAFQRAAWQALAAVPWGETRTYGELAREVDRPGGARAIGMAMNRNPISIILPCHRILGADRSLTGYGGGLERKRFLLELEGVLQPRLAL